MSTIFDASADTIVAQLYLAYLGRAPDLEGFSHWKGEYAELLEAADGDTAAAFGALAGRIQDAATANGEFAPDDSSSAATINYVYEHILGREPDEEGLNYWVEALDGNEEAEVEPVPLHDIVAQLVDSALRQETTRDAMYLSNRTEVALAYLEAAPTYDPDGEQAENILEGVDDSRGSVDAALEELNRVDGERFDLTAEQDRLIGEDGGTDGDDVFVANVVQNSLGQQVNSLGSGDVIDGAGGTDTLNAKITSGVFAGGGESMPIQPETQSVEIINLQGVIADIPVDDDQANNDHVYLNAKDMTGVDEINSLYSDASLTVQNMTSRAQPGDDSNQGRSLSDLSVGMKYSGNGDTRWDASDFNVYFDQDFIKPETSGKLSVSMDVMNEDAYDEGLSNDAIGPLDGVYLDKMAFTINDETFDLAPIIQDQTGEDAASAGNIISTYEELLTATQDAIVALKAQHPDNAALQSLQATLGANFDADISPISGQVRVGQSLVMSIDNASQENSLTVRSSDLTLNRVDDSDVPNNNRYERAEVYDPEVDATVAINVALEKAGLAGDGGALVIGSMAKGDDVNAWSEEFAGKGIEQFNATVYGDASKPSSLAELRSTNNNLREVNVTTEAGRSGELTQVVDGEVVDGDFADLIIGNRETDTDAGELGTLAGNAEALKDVRLFDASEFKGDLKLHAALTAEVADKYMNLRDGAPDESQDDNINFVYSGGDGFDEINLALDATNLADAGTTTREDFTLRINGNGGNDEIITSVQVGPEAVGISADENGLANGLESGAEANWYTNSKINSNLTVDAGDGDDTVHTLGSGDWTVNLGAGNDTAYLDNSGEKAVWVFNTADQTTAEAPARDIDNLLSGENDTYEGLGGAQLSVTLSRPLRNDPTRVSEFTSLAVAVPNTDQNLTDADINQAIKTAINTDPELSKLLVAEDGPGATLVVTSLIDGLQVGTDLTVNLAAPDATELTDADVSSYNSSQGTSLQSVAELAQEIQDRIDNSTVADSYTAALANDGDEDLAGTWSAHVADNVITGGAGDDVLVLGTGEFSNDIVKYEGLDNGFDTIVNFTDGASADGLVDQLDFTSYEAAALYVAAEDVDGNVSAGDLVSGTAVDQLTADGVVIRLVEQWEDGSLQEGVYEIQKVTLAGNSFTDANVEVIGTADFGRTLGELAADNILL